MQDVVHTMEYDNELDISLPLFVDDVITNAISVVEKNETVTENGIWKGDSGRVGCPVAGQDQYPDRDNKQNALISNQFICLF